MVAKNIRKKSIPLIVAAMCVLMCTVPAMADDGIDLTKSGSISVDIRAYATDEAVGGGSLDLYRVADIGDKNGDFYYAYTEAFSGCSGDLLTEEELDKAETAQTFSEWVSAHDVAPEETATVSSAGEAYFADLSCGLYLVAQDTPAEGYNAINAFLVTIPIDEDGTYVYDVDATPKTSPVTKNSGRLTFYLVDFHTDEPLAGGFVLVNGSGEYAVAQETLASAWNPFSVIAYAAESAGAVTWTGAQSPFTVPLSGITFDGVGEGTYTLTELSQPDGYLLPEGSVSVTVDADGIAQVASAPYYEDEPIAVAGGEAWDGEITVKNVKSETIKSESGNPETGGTGNPDTSGAGGGSTSGSGNAKTGDYNYFVYGILVIAAAVAIGVVVRRRSRAAR